MYTYLFTDTDIFKDSKIFLKHNKALIPGTYEMLYKNTFRERGDSTEKKKKTISNTFKDNQGRKAIN